MSQKSLLIYEGRLCVSDLPVQARGERGWPPSRGRLKLWQAGSTRNGRVDGSALLFQLRGCWYGLAGWQAWTLMLIRILGHTLPLCPSPTLACDSEVSYPAVIAPVAGAAPPQRLGLGPADLARLWVLVAVELWRGATPHTSGGGLVGLWWC